MTKGTAKIKKAASKVGAVLTGKFGVLSTLEGEHSEVSTLMDDVSESQSTQKQRKLYDQIRQDLLVHSQGEEQGLYAEAKAHGSTRDMAEKSIRDHAQIKQILSTLDQQAIGTPQWQQSFESLKRVVEAHTEFEEEQLFPKLKSTLSADRLRDLDQRYRAFRKRIEETGERLEPPKPPRSSVQ